MPLFFRDSVLDKVKLRPEQSIMCGSNVYGLLCIMYIILFIVTRASLFNASIVGTSGSLILYGLSGYTVHGVPDSSVRRCFHDGTCVPH